jgi:leader peptidase (prepilin peptidase)/N-methyltransferase
VAIAGLVIGSFLNVLILRSESLKTILYTRSYCPKCKHTLSWKDLVPVFSFVFLRGKCRYCGGKISPQYPTVELVNGLLYLLLFYFFGLSSSFIFYCIVGSLLLVIAVYDLRTQYTPELFVWIALVLAVIGGGYFGNLSLKEVIYGALIGGGLPALLVLVSKEKWMGSGDIKIGLILGFLLGYPNVIVALFLSFVIGAIVGIIYIKIKDKTIKDSLPFTPFLIFSMFAALLWGERIINWYLGSFFLGVN